MRETRLSGSEGGARFKPLSLPLSKRFARIEASLEVTPLPAPGLRWGQNSARFGLLPAKTMRN